MTKCDVWTCVGCGNRAAQEGHPGKCGCGQRNEGFCRHENPDAKPCDLHLCNENEKWLSRGG